MEVAIMNRVLGQRAGVLEQVFGAAASPGHEECGAGLSAVEGGGGGAKVLGLGRPQGGHVHLVRKSNPTACCRVGRSYPSKVVQDIKNCSPAMKIPTQRLI